MLRTPLAQSIMTGGRNMARFLINRGAGVNNNSSNGRTRPLFFACTHGMTDIAQLLINRGATINARTTDGRTALHGAVIGRSLECVRLLISRGANVNAQDNNGETPLFYACLNQVIVPDIIEALVLAGANPRIASDSGNNAGKTPLDKLVNRPKNAARNDALLVMVKHGASVTTWNNLQRLMNTNENLRRRVLALTGGAGRGQSVASRLTRRETGLTPRNRNPIPRGTKRKR